MHEENSEQRTFLAQIPITFHLPGGKGGYIVREVLGGEYESGYTGDRLTVLDIGANIGAFSLWAAHRWPGCTVEAYEPNPATFTVLERNCRFYPMIRCHNVAAYPSSGPDEIFFSRGAGDGQAGLVKELASTFGDDVMSRGEQLLVPVLHPRELPKADVVKIDVEGAEVAIITHADLSGTSLVMLEFQHRRYLDAIKEHLAGEFDVAYERREPWSSILSLDAYRQSLAGDEYGVVFFIRRGQTRLWRPPEAVPAAAGPRSNRRKKGPLKRLKKLWRRLRESGGRGGRQDKR